MPWDACKLDDTKRNGAAEKAPHLAGYPSLKPGPCSQMIAERKNVGHPHEPKRAEAPEGGKGLLYVHVCTRERLPRTPCALGSPRGRLSCATCRSAGPVCASTRDWRTGTVHYAPRARGRRACVRLLLGCSRVRVSSLRSLSSHWHSTGAGERREAVCTVLVPRRSRC